MWLASVEFLEVLGCNHVANQGTVYNQSQHRPSRFYSELFY